MTGWTILGLGLIGLTALALYVWRRPDDASAFIRGITIFKWGLGGIEIQRQIAEASQGRPSDPDKVRRSLQAVPTRGRVLWVDDQPENNHAEMALLRSRGLIVDVSATNQGALTLARRQQTDGRPYDLVITDRGRTNGERSDAGLQLPDTLKAVDPTLPIIYYTSSAADSIGGYENTSDPADLFAAITHHLG